MRSPLFGAGNETLEAVVAEMLIQRNLTLSIAESVTGGLLASTLVSVPGASKFLRAGYVTYSSESKVRDLGLPPELLEEYGAVSEEVALAMAAGAREKAGTEVGLATTGEAGPEPAGAEVGQIYVAVAWSGGAVARGMWAGHAGPGPAGREEIRRRASQEALDLLRLWLLGAAGASSLS
ncbi:MAG: CinA family protein [Actinomycetota bacterium]